MSTSRQAILRTELSNSTVDSRSIRSHIRSDISSVCKAPLHDFPVRDEILLQFLPITHDMDVMEIGPGSGFTAYWLSHLVRRLTLVDVSSSTIQALREESHFSTGVDFVQWDLARPGLADALVQRYDAVFGLDIFEYVSDAATGFRNLASVLRPGGTLLISFPNTPPPEGDGVTYFTDAASLERLLKQSGFTGIEIFTVHLRNWPRWIYTILHEWPIELVRYLRTPGKSPRPQTYDDTWMFRSGKRLARLKVPLNVAWSILGWTLRLDGDVFAENPHALGIVNRQLVIRAQR